MADPLVERVLDVWTPRFLRVGITWEDLNATVARIDTWDDWCREWTKTAEEHERLAETWLEAGDELSAAEALQRASVYYHTGAFVYFRDLDQHNHGYRKMVETYERSLPLLGGRIQKVRFPFEDVELVGLLSVPAGADRPPVVILIPGLDSTKEGRHSGRRTFLERGLAVFSIDGPGQGEMSFTTKIRPDYEAPIAAAIDYLETRDDVDASRVGLIGSSLGGYYAPRAAAFEPRVRACIAISGPFTFSMRRPGMLPVSREAFAYYAGAKSDEETDRLAETLTLEGCAAKITCPLMSLAGKRDPLVSADHAQRIYDAASGPKVLHVFEDGNHSLMNIPHKVMPLQLQFLRAHLQG
jgi:dipeptidyl aminopeptidase/acylaminoacyl peptidase